jgi:hypothetical protein
MNIGSTEEQELLRTSARRLLQNKCPTALVRQRMAEPTAVTDDFRQKLAGQGRFCILSLSKRAGVVWTSST